MINLETASWEDLKNAIDTHHVTLWCSTYMEEYVESYFEKGMRFSIENIQIDPKEDGCVTINVDLNGHILFNAMLESNRWFDQHNKPRLDGHGQRFEKTIYLDNSKAPREYFTQCTVEPLYTPITQYPDSNVA